MLDLNDLGHGLPAITPYFGMALAEAGAYAWNHSITRKVFNLAFKDTVIIAIP